MPRERLSNVVIASMIASSDEDMTAIRVAVQVQLLIGTQGDRVTGHEAEEEEQSQP